MSDVTELLQAVRAGEADAAPQLLSSVYDELRIMATQRMAREKPGHTLDATGLVHEAYLRLVGEQQFDNRRHFFAAAAEAMRRILVESARRKARQRHGGGRQRVELADPPAPDANEEMLALDKALTRLAEEDATAARVVEMHHFAGLSHEQVAEVLGVTVYHARKKWTYARAWLRVAVGNQS